MDEEKEDELNEELSTAIYLGKYEECVKLLNEGASSTKPDAFITDTPLFAAAARQNRGKIIKLLLERGANPNERDYKDNTPLSIAAGLSDVETVKVLVENGADLFSRNNGGWTPLMQACLQGSTDTLRYLLEKGANANDKAENERNITALMLAAGAGSVDKIKLLLEFGADPFAKDDVDLTAHDYARFAIQTNCTNDTTRWREVLEVLPPVHADNQPKQYERVPLSECPVCKGVKDYEDAKVSGWDSDYRKYFFRVMNCLSEGYEIHEGYKFYSRTSVYECPRCGSFYKKRVTQDFDNTYVEYELSVNRISKGEADYLVQQISEKKL